MKKISLLLLVCSVLFLSQSCKEDCPGIACNTGSLNVETCTCTCPDGFSGTNCEIEDLCVTQSVDCKNGGTCTNGDCDCPSGYEGSDCSELWRDKYLHEDYAVVAECGSDTNNFSGKITADPTDDLKMNIHIFDQVEFILKADLLTSITFDVPEQELIQGLPSVSGSGVITDNGVVTVNLMGGANCTYTYTRN